jgi:hypothetical protein
LFTETVVQKPRHNFDSLRLGQLVELIPGGALLLELCQVGLDVPLTHPEVHLPGGESVDNPFNKFETFKQIKKIFL